MSSDIKLEENFVVAEGNALKVNAWDIMLDGGPGRRGGAGGDYRRALVHSDKDVLTINFNKDYTGGVEIEGGVYIGNLRVQHISGTPWLGGPTMIYLKANDIIIGHKAEGSPADLSGTNYALSYDWKEDRLIINKEYGFKGGVKIEGDISITGSLYVDKGVTCRDLRTSNKVYAPGEVIIGDPDAMISEPITDRSSFLAFHPAIPIFAISIAANEIFYWETMLAFPEWNYDSPLGVKYQTRVRQPIRKFNLIETIKDLQERIAKLEEKVFGS